jgi:hypothetical protein
MSLTSDWRQRKSALDRVGVKTAIFNQDISSRLTAFETAEKNFDRRPTNLRKTDPQVVGLLTKLKTAATALAPVATVYESTLRHLSENAKDPKQKPALADATNFLFTVLTKCQLAQKQ